MPVDELLTAAIRLAFAAGVFAFKNGTPLVSADVDEQVISTLSKIASEAQTRVNIAEIMSLPEAKALTFVSDRFHGRVVLPDDEKVH
jgi:hypothetical protein